MKATDLLWLVGLVLIAAGGVSVGTCLRRHPDWHERLARAQATVFVRANESGFWLVHHAWLAVRGPSRLRHLERAFLALVFLIVLALPPLLAASWAAKPLIAEHGVALAGGMFVWSALVESPALSHRLPTFARNVTPLPVPVSALIVFVLNAVASVIALSGVIHGEAVSTFFYGASFIALADVVSAVLGIAIAGLDDYPLGEVVVERAATDDRRREGKYSPPRVNPAP